MVDGWIDGFEGREGRKESSIFFLVLVFVYFVFECFR